MLFGMLLIACGPYPPQPPPGPQCRTDDQACDKTTDCCNPLVCVNNFCKVKSSSDTCGDNRCGATETQDNCCADCGCPAGKSCVTGTCKPDTVTSCGDNICNGLESTATCCTDCGCPGGYYCNGSACVSASSCGVGCPNGYSCNGGFMRLRWNVHPGVDSEERML
mgnify:FL=1